MSNKKKNKLLRKRIINYTGIAALTAGAGVGLAYGIKYATGDHRYNKYTGDLVRALNNIQRNGNDKRFLVSDIINDAYLDDGRGNRTPISFDAIFDAQKNNPSQVQAEIDKIDKQYSDKVLNTHVNYNLVIETDIIRFENNYFDIFGTKDTLDFLDYLLNEVPWGVDVFSLYDFKLVRGVPKDGGVITLGGNNATRNKSSISFWPDAFFGVLPVLDLGGESVLTTTNNITLQGVMGIGNNKNILYDFMTHTVNGEKALPMQIVDQWELFTKFTSVSGNDAKTLNHPDAIELTTDNRMELQHFFTAEVWENWVKVFGDAVLNDMSKNAMFDGTDSVKVNSQVPGNFPSLLAFNNYVKGKHDLPVVDTIKAEDGVTDITVYPWDCMRRVLLATYFSPMTRNDLIREFGQNAPSNPNYSNYSKTARDSQRKRLSASGIYVSDYPYVQFNSFIYSHDFASQHLDWNITDPYIFTNFVGFDRVVPKESANRIAQAMHVAIGIDPYKTIAAAELDSNGEPMQTLLYEKYLDILPTFERIKEEEGWSPIEFEGDKVYEDQFIPLLYLWTKMVDEDGNRYASFADTTYAKDGSLTPEQIRELDRQTNEVIGKHDIGIEWLKYVTSHEYGHHKTLRSAKDLSDTTDHRGGATSDITTPGQVYAGASWNTNYENVWSRNFVNNYFLARTGIGGNIFVDDEHAGQINQLLADFTVQYNAHASKEAPYFAILGGDTTTPGAATPIIGTDAQGNPIINEQAAVDFADFAMSWRGFKTLQQTVEEVVQAAIDEGVISGDVVRSGDMPSNIALLAALMNSADRNSFTLGSALPIPETGFEGNGNPTDGAQTGTETGIFRNLNPRDLGLSEDQVDLSRWIRGWHDYTGESLQISTDTNIFTFLNYKQQVRDDQGNIVIGPDGKPVTTPLTLPRSFVRSFMQYTFDFDAYLEKYVEFNADGSISGLSDDIMDAIQPPTPQPGTTAPTPRPVDEIFDEFFRDRLLHLFYGGNAYNPSIVAPDPSQVDTTLDLIFADAREARNWYVRLAYDPSTGKYYPTLADVPGQHDQQTPSTDEVVFLPAPAPSLTSNDLDFLVHIDDNTFDVANDVSDEFKTLILSSGIDWDSMITKIYDDGDVNGFALTSPLPDWSSVSTNIQTIFADESEYTEFVRIMSMIQGGAPAPQSSYIPTNDQMNTLMDIDYYLSDDQTAYNAFISLVDSWGIKWGDLQNGDFNQQVTPGTTLPDFSSIDQSLHDAWLAVGLTEDNFNTMISTISLLGSSGQPSNPGQPQTPEEIVLDIINNVANNDVTMNFDAWLSSFVSSELVPQGVVSAILNNDPFSLTRPLPTLAEFKNVDWYGTNIYADVWVGLLNLSDSDYEAFVSALTALHGAPLGPEPYMTDVLISSGLVSINGGSFSFMSVMAALAAAYESDPARPWVIRYSVDGISYSSEFVVDSQGNPTTERVTSSTPDAILDTFNLRMQRIVANAEAPTSDSDINWLKSQITEVWSFLMDIVCDELNKEVDRTQQGQQGRFIYADAPIRQGAIGEEDFREVLGQIFGSKTFTGFQNDQLGSTIATSIFQSYFQNYGRFFQIQTIDPSAIGSTTAYYPSVITLMMFMYANIPSLNWTYTTYLAQGAFPYYGQITVDYQTSLAEMLTRDWNQLSYSPSQNPLQQTNGKNYNEMNNMVVYSLFPIYTHMFTEDGAVVPIPGTGIYNEDTGELIPKTMTSGFFEDLALRRETDSSLYNLDRVENLMIDGKQVFLKDENGVDTTTPIQGHPINHMGKALVNFFREAFGISEYRDVSNFYVDEETGFGTISGYISETDADRFHFIGLKDTVTGRITYVPIHKIETNEFFNTQLGVRQSRVSMLNHYYDENGDLVTLTDRDRIQVGWTTDSFLMKGYDNSFFEPGHDYEIFFAETDHAQAPAQGTPSTTSESRYVNLGFNFRTTEINAGDDHTGDTDDIYSVHRDWRREMVANSFDTFTGTVFMEQQVRDDRTIIRITSR